MGEIDYWLEHLYWLAQIALPVLLIWAGRLAWPHVQAVTQRLDMMTQQIDLALQEAQSTKLSRILNYLEEQRIQDARNVVMTEIRREEEAGKNWWEGDDRMQRAAAQLCGTYDHVGALVKFDGPDHVGQYFLQCWGERISRAHDILARFLTVLRSSAGPAFSGHRYEDFTWLANEARQIQGNKRAPKPPPSR